MSKTGKLISLILAVISITCLFCVSSYAATATATANLTMQTEKNTFIYTKESEAEKYRGGYLSFGEDVKVVSKGSLWTKISYEGKTRYVKTAKIGYIQYTAVKNTVKVNPSAADSTSSKCLGYIHYGTDVSKISVITGKDGKKYLKCIIPVTYTSSGKVKSKNVTGYVRYDYTAAKSTPKVVKSGVNLYSYAFGNSSDGSLKVPATTIKTGELVYCLQKNDTWSKIKYNNKTYFISTKNLDDYKLRVTAKSVKQTAEATSTSKAIHYVYWNTQITVLNTYESATYGTYYYCKVSGDYGFIRDHLTSGKKNVGDTYVKYTNCSCSIYKKADSLSTKLAAVKPDTEVITGYKNGSWTAATVNGKSGYMLTSNLESKKMYAQGNYYTSAYKLYKDKPSGQLDTPVTLLAKNESYGYAYVLTSAGKYYWMNLTAIIPAEEPSVTMYTNVPYISIREKADSASKQIILPYMTEIEVQGVASTLPTGTWTRVKYNGGNYYLWQNTGTDALTETRSTFKYKAENPYAQEVIDLAVHFALEEPTKYVHHQSNGIPDADGKYGFDCSGFASYLINTVMQKYNPLFNLSADIQQLYEVQSIYNNGFNGNFLVEDVKYEDIQPGDVVFFLLPDETDDSDISRGYDHCAVYLGNGEFAHSTYAYDQGVNILPLGDERYMNSMIAIKRYIPYKITPADTVMYTTKGLMKIYPEKDSTTEPVTLLAKYAPVILKFTNNGNWAYVEYEPGKCGYIMAYNLQANPGE